jgi:hypothetical protein
MPHKLWVLALCLLSGNYSLARCSAVHFVAYHPNKSKINYYEDISKTNYTGYVVYMSDTIHGTILINKAQLSITTAQGTKNVYNMFDVSLNNVFLVNSTQDSMFLAKPVLGDTLFYRLVHRGSLSLLDNHFVFNYNPKAIHLSEMRVAYADKAEDMNTFCNIGHRKRLIHYVNKVYGTQLKPRGFSKKELLANVGQLS